MLIVGLMVVGTLSASAVKTWAEDPKSTAEKSSPAPSTYACPMHPQVQATFPGSCPICRLALKAKGSNATVEVAPMNHAGQAHPGMNMGDMDMGAMSCPQCMMGMGGMPTKAAPVVPVAPGKIMPSSYRSAGGRRCGR